MSRRLRGVRGLERLRGLAGRVEFQSPYPHCVSGFARMTFGKSQVGLVGLSVSLREGEGEGERERREREEKRREEKRREEKREREREKKKKHDSSNNNPNPTLRLNSQKVPCLFLRWLLGGPGYFRGLTK